MDQHHGLRYSKGRSATTYVALPAETECSSDLVWDLPSVSSAARACNVVRCTDCLTPRATYTAPHTLRYCTALGLVQRCANRASGKQHISIPVAASLPTATCTRS